MQQIFYRLGGSKKDGTPAVQLFKAPKSAKSRRTVALPSILVDELRALQIEQAERRMRLGRFYEDSDLVFCQMNGKPLHAHNVGQRDLRGVVVRAGVPRTRFHDFRHAHATLLLRQGVHPKIVQERLGHSTIAMTLDTYSHVMPGMQEQAVAGLQARLFGNV